MSRVTAVEVRQARAGDWRELRELRLRALADAPGAFASTLERDAAIPEAEWRRRAGGGPTSVSFIARQGDAGIGMAAVVAEPGVPGRMQLVGMWVDPAHRRGGVAWALLGLAVRWARRRQARELTLWVVEGNTAARALYQRAGFRPTGRRQPLPSNPAVTEMLLRLPLGGHGEEPPP